MTKPKTTIRLNPGVKEAGIKYAEATNRSLSNLLEYLLIAELKRRGVKYEKM